MDPCLLLLDHLSCLSQRKTRWTMSVHLFCLKIYILGTSTSMVPLPFFSWCKPKLSRDNFNSQSAALQSSGPTSWSRLHSVNRPLLIARFWRSTEVKLIKCSIPKGAGRFHQLVSSSSRVWLFTLFRDKSKPTNRTSRRNTHYYMISIRVNMNATCQLTIFNSL
jgi:hypothetical protein